MKKWIFFFGFFAILISACCALYVYTYRVDFAQTILSRILRTPVQVAAIEISKDGLYVQKLEVHNPADCLLQNAFSCSSINFKMNWKELTKAFIDDNSKGIVVDEVRICQPYMSLELFNLLGSDNNWTRILNHLNSKKPTRDKHKPARTFTIKKIILENIQVEIRNHLIGKAVIRPKEIEQIEINDIGSKSPMTSQQLVYIIATTVLNQVGKNLDLPSLSREILLNSRNSLSDFSVQGGDVRPGAPRGIQQKLYNITHRVNQATEELKKIFQ